MFAVIGFNNKVYWNSNERNFTEALNQALDEFIYSDLYVKYPISDKFYQDDFNETVDLNDVFFEMNGNPISYSMIDNADPNAASVSVEGSILSIIGLADKQAQTTVTVKAVSGENEAVEEFVVNVDDPSLFKNFEEGFESDIFPPPFWSVKYNTSEDGGLNGSLLKDPGSRYTWFKNDINHPWWGATYIHSGENSAMIEYYAPDFNWLITPLMVLDYDDYKLNYWIWFSAQHFESKLFLLVESDGAWTILKTYNASVPDNVYETEEDVSLSLYNGKKIRLAFVYEWTDGYELAIDDVRITSVLSGISESNIASSLELYQNYPNPFNPETKLSFSIPETMPVSLSVFNHKGEVVRNLFSGKLEKGSHKFSFDGSGLTSGIYFYKLETEKGSSMKKMIMLK
jgi:hypothetical protein